ncbi:MAG TPA: DHA2 family efflux MFS transporter permease subunit [Gemmatimonadaceae bacterium]|nr:DHA2 family efflux MFS transporter permease subunit [Gemmatimonadaceae bacterium]
MSTAVAPARPGAAEVTGTVAAAAPRAAPAADTGDPHKYIIALAVVLASVMQVIDSSIVNVAIPHMMGNFGASIDEIAWVSTAYILASVIVIPMTGWLAGFFGRTRYFVTSILIFTAASFFCGASGSLGALVFWRVVQGIGGGALIATSQAILYEAFPRREAGTAMALFGVGIMVGPTIGPTLGGWITDNFSWPWIFYINLPIGILAAVMIAAYVRDSAHQQKSKTIDFLGIALLTVSVGALQYLLEHGERDGWFESPLMAALAAISVVAGVLLVWREFTVDEPVIDFRVLRHREMWVGVIIGVVFGVALLGSVFVLPVFLQNMLHMTAQQTGLVLLPGALATAVTMGTSSKLTKNIDARLVVTVGAVFFFWSMVELSHLTTESGTHDFFWPLIWRGFGLGLMFVPLTNITLADLSPREMPQGTALYNFFRTLGGSFGIALMATLLTRFTAEAKAILAEHVGVTDPIALERVAAMTRAFVAKGSDPSTAHAMALRAMDAQLAVQANVIAFGRVYYLSGLILLSCIPLLLLVRKTKPAGKVEMYLE